MRTDCILHNAGQQLGALILLSWWDLIMKCVVIILQEGKENVTKCQVVSRLTERMKRSVWTKPWVNQTSTLSPDCSTDASISCEESYRFQRGWLNFSTFHYMAKSNRHLSIYWPSTSVFVECRLWCCWQLYTGLCPLIFVHGPYKGLSNTEPPE